MSEPNNNGNGGGKVLIGFLTATSILSGAAALVTPLYFLTGSHEEKIAAMHASDVASAYHRGTVDQRLQALKDRQDKNVMEIADLDTRLQREMRDVNAVTDAKLNGLDARLQGEIATLSATLNGSLDRIDAHQLSDRQEQLDNLQSLGRLDERIKALERR